MNRAVLYLTVGAVFLLLVLGAAHMFTLYSNRYGKKLVLRRDVYDLFTAMRAKLKAQGIDVEMTDAWRGQTEQEKVLAAGNSKANWGQSAHNYAVAFDVAPIIGGKLSWPNDAALWAKIGAAGKSVGLDWGGDFTTITDYPHFQLHGWYTDAKAGKLALLPQAPATLPA